MLGYVSECEFKLQFEDSFKRFFKPLCFHAMSFVKDADNGEKYFFHISSAPATIAEGDRVTFEIERGMRGMNAVRISIVTELFELRLYKK